MSFIIWEVKYEEVDLLGSGAVADLTPHLRYAQHLHLLGSLSGRLPSTTPASSAKGGRHDKWLREVAEIAGRAFSAVDVSLGMELDANRDQIQRRLISSARCTTASTSTSLARWPLRGFRLTSSRTAQLITACSCITAFNFILASAMERREICLNWLSKYFLLDKAWTKLGHVLDNAGLIGWNIFVGQKLDKYWTLICPCFA